MAIENTIVPHIIVVTERPAMEDMVGLEDQLQRIRSITTSTAYRNVASQLGAQLPVGFTNAMFVGPQGVGKTTLAKVFAFELRDAGLVKAGEPIRLIKGSNLIGGWVGHTEGRVNELFEIAKDGPAIIDEIDAILSSSQFCKAAFDTLNTNLGHAVNKPIIIGTCYASNLESMWAVNQGLSGRFPHVFRIEAGGLDKMFDIFSHKMERAGLEVDRPAGKLAREVLQEMKRAKGQNFANGRDVDNLIEAVINAKADRARAEGHTHLPTGWTTLPAPQKDAFRKKVLTITAADVPHFDITLGGFVTRVEKTPEPARPVGERVVALPVRGATTSPIGTGSS